MSQQRQQQPTRISQKELRYVSAAQAALSDGACPFAGIQSLISQHQGSWLVDVPALTAKVSYRYLIWYCSSSRSARKYSASQLATASFSVISMSWDCSNSSCSQSQRLQHDTWQLQAAPSTVTSIAMVQASAATSTVVDLATATHLMLPITGICPSNILTLC
jgi:hypothetical protein